MRGKPSRRVYGIIAVQKLILICEKVIVENSTD